MRPPRPRRRAPGAIAALLLLVAVPLAAGCEEDEQPSEEPNALERCGSLRRVYDQFGETIAGPYAASALASYRFALVESSFEDRFFGAGSMRLGVVTPSGTPCELDIASRLEGACLTCQTSSFEACLLEVEAAFATPSEACEACGDGRCTGSELPATCPDDCRCGNGTCEVLLGELPTNCPEDCPVSCGNGICERLGGETCACPEGAAGCHECARDCCVVVCGDGSCEPDGGETLENCEQDCGSGTCGDGFCLGNERPQSCPQDCPMVNCAICPTCFATTFGLNGVFCGDGVCSGCEPWSCRLDCEESGIDFCTRDENGQRICPGKYCGDGACEGVEDYIVCPQDCHFDGFGLELCSDQQCTRTDHAFFAYYAQPEQCTDIALCAGQLCGDGYCQAGETPQIGAHPLEGETTCAQDCGSFGCPELDRAALCADGFEPLRCEYVVPEGHTFGFNAVVDCSLPCPVAMQCAQLCSEDAGEPACIVCPGFPQTSAPPCDPGDPDICLGDTPMFCRPSQPDAADRPECYIYDPITAVCENGCNPDTGQCNP